MQFWITLLVAMAPAMILLGYIYWKDRLRREPVKKILGAFGMGVLSVFLSLTITSLYHLPEAQNFRQMVQENFFNAAMPEEIAKFIMFWLFVRWNKYFDERMDGIVYASCVALGFAGLENCFYLFNNSDSLISVGVTRSLLSVPGHFFDGVLMGYFYSRVHFDGASKINFLFMLGVPILLHGTFNSLIDLVKVPKPHLLGLIALLLPVIFIWLVSRVSRKSMDRHLEADAVMLAEAESAVADD